MYGLPRDGEGDVQPRPASGGDRASTRACSRLFVELGAAGARSPLANLETSRISWRPRHAGAGAEAGREAGRVAEGLVGNDQGQVDRACQESGGGSAAGNSSCCGCECNGCVDTQLEQEVKALGDRRGIGGQEGREGAARRIKAHRDGVGGQQRNRSSDWVDNVSCVGNAAEVCASCNHKRNGSHCVKLRSATATATGRAGDRGGKRREHRGSLVVPHLSGALQPHLVEAGA